MNFTKPIKLNGADLMKELENAGVIVDKIKDNGEGILIIDIDETKKTIVEEVLSKHKGIEYPDKVAIARASAINKLIDLGLTEEEAKAFLG